MLSDAAVNGLFLFVIKQKRAYDMRISDWSSDVCSSDLQQLFKLAADQRNAAADVPRQRVRTTLALVGEAHCRRDLDRHPAHFDFKLTGPFLQIPAIALGNAHFRRHEFFCEIRQRHIGAGGIANADRELVRFLLMFEHFDILEPQPGVLALEVFAVAEHLDHRRRRSLEGLLLFIFHMGSLQKKAAGLLRRPDRYNSSARSRLSASSFSAPTAR